MLNIRLLVTAAVFAGCAKKTDREIAAAIDGLRERIATMEASIGTRFDQVSKKVDLQLNQKSDAQVKMDLQRLRKQMKGRGLENSAMDLEVQRIQDSIGSGVVTATQKKELRKRIAEIDITLNDNPAESNLRGVNS